MSARFLVLCIDRPLASGGVAVLYDAVQILTEAGHDAMIVHGRPGFRHMNGEASVSIGHSNRIALAENARWQPQSLRQKLRKARTAMARPADSFDLRPDDIIVVPELMLRNAMIAYPAHRKVLFSQNPYLYLEAVREARLAGLDPVAGIALNLGISRNCMAAFEAVGVTQVAYFPVAPRLDLFPYRHEKSQLITYMPRKRPAEAEVLEAALRRRGNLRGFDLLAIDGMAPEEVARSLAGTSVFVSLLKDEALGFPAAEAMAAGCVVVGYTGQGTEEYFDSNTGIPVQDGDILGLIEAVEDTVARLNRDPSAFDAMRRRASDRVHATYTRAAFREGLLTAVERLVA